MGAVRSQSSWRKNGDEEKLRRLWRVEGLTGTQIANRLGVSRGAVLGKLHRMGLVGQRGAAGVRRSLSHDELLSANRKSIGDRRLVASKPVMTAWRSSRGLPGLPDGDGIKSIAVLPNDPALSERVTFEQLKRHHCRWPFEDGTFCGRDRRDINTSYCTEHRSRAYRPTTPLVETGERAVEQYSKIRAAATRRRQTISQ